MPRPVLLFSGQWTDVPLEELAPKLSEWGYQGVELACWGDHFEIQRALSEPDYCQKKLDLLAKYDLSTVVLGNHRTSTAVCDRIDERHGDLLADYVWGDGDPDGVRQRAQEEMVATVQAAQKLGVSVLTGFTGSPIWHYVNCYPTADARLIAEGFKDFAVRWKPILDACQAAGIKFALEVHPGQIAFDLYSAERTLEALDGREEFGFLFDPSHFHWQGLDPVEFLRRFPDRIFHVHIKDTALTLNGRTSVLNSYLPYGDPRRGWDFRAPGRGGIDWEAVIRALNEIGYEGPLAVEFKDAAVEREYGAEEACQFVKRLDFEPSRRGGNSAFHAR
ncbi:MAG TPA: sugar phosphate isomerase/epimerase [Gemmataceae bacterium]|nr:sugar phosphate isomerase/epimerase [Gemmataceae bacterium]